MNVWRQYLATAGLLFVAAVLEAGLARHLAIYDARPSFLLVLALSYGLSVRPGRAAVVACVSGVLTGGLSGASMAAFTVGRTLVCFFLGFLERVEIKVALPLGAALVAVGTCVDAGFTMLISPPSDIGGFMRATIGSAVYNGVLAFPIYGLVRRMFRNKDD
ncbi:MAG: hypothetical protein KF857_10640 [Fimbriimonadaceae bacterium]|nr:hypothetical protein [Fimbriimonadaceae bacterium]